MNKKILLTILLITALLTPTTYACPTSTDEQLKQNAIDCLIAEHPELSGGQFTAVITSEWEYHPHLDAPWHKHVTVDVKYGYCNTGTAHWEGRSYDLGGVYTFVYEYTSPQQQPVKQEPFKCDNLNVVRLLGPIWYWNGRMWVYNTPTVEVIDNVVYITYPSLT